MSQQVPHANIIFDIPTIRRRCTHHLMSLLPTELFQHKRSSQVKRRSNSRFLAPALLDINIACEADAILRRPGAGKIKVEIGVKRKQWS